MDDRRGSKTHRLGEAYFLDLLGDACNSLGRYDEAAEAFSMAVDLFKENEAYHAHAVSLLKLAQTYLALTRRDLAIRYLEECLPIFRRLRLPASEQQARAALDACLLAIA